jgi:DNA topoisomerase-3
MQLILAEKPSQARDIAKAFKDCRNRDGYIECAGGWFITWAFGHLFEIDTEKIFPFGRILDFPEKFEYRLISRSHAKQFRVIKSLLQKADEVYIFSDPEREGELLARLILYQAGWKKWEKTYRFWSSKALTPDVVWEEIRAKRPAKNFDSIYYEALARQHSDWLVGIPLSRVITAKVRSAGSWSVGRVQTPALRLIVEREIERENFVPQDYYVIKAFFQKESGEKYEGILVLKEKAKMQSAKEDDSEEDEVTEKENIESLGVSPEKAKEVLAELKKEREGVVLSVDKKIKKEPPPFLYSLTVLQRDASKLFGFSASKTLNVAQSLYEKHLISYPRTESQHLSSRDRNLVISVLRKLGRADLIPVVGRVGKRVFDDSKLTDHFALIPLNKPKSGLSDDEKKIYDLIVKRFLAAFYPDFMYEETRVITKAGKYNFLSKGKVIIQKGWTELYGERESVVLPSLSKGERVRIDGIISEKKKTKPQARYTDGALISRMKKLGIGTPATRAAIIESLIKRGYIIRNKKELIPSSKGRELIENLKKKNVPLVSVDMTAEWERELKKIREEKLGFRGYSDFVEKIKRFVVHNAKVLEDIEIDVKKISEPVFKRKIKKSEERKRRQQE